MATTTYKGAYLPAVSGDSGTWGTNLNSSTFPVFDSNLGGIVTKSLSSSNVTLTSGESQNAILRLTGTLSANVIITTACQGFTFVNNQTTGSYTVTVSYTGGVGSSVVVPQGVQSLVVFDATNGAYLVSPGTTFASLTVTGNASISGALSVSGAETLTEISTPSAPASGKVQIYGYAGDYLASQTPGGIQRIYGKDPTVQTFLTPGSGTYTPTSGTVRIRVRMVGPSGGSGGSGGAGGAASGNTVFGSWTAVAGSPGSYMGYAAGATAGGAGGTGGANGTGTLIIRTSGGNGGDCGISANVLVCGPGGASVLGGQGGLTFASTGYAVGAAPAANSGSGASGGLEYNYGAGSASGAGEYVEFYVTSPTATSYTVPSGGTAGAVGYVPGAAGSSGGIWIEEFYS